MYEVLELRETVDTSTSNQFEPFAVLFQNFFFLEWLADHGGKQWIYPGVRLRQIIKLEVAIEEHVTVDTRYASKAVKMYLCKWPLEIS